MGLDRSIKSFLKVAVFFTWVLVLGVGGGGQLAYGHVSWQLTSNDIARVYDGDTFYINLTGLPPVFGKELPIRVRGVDTPELRSRCGSQTAKEREKAFGQYVRDQVIQYLLSAQRITIHEMERGSFFRVVADVVVDGVDLRQWLLDKGYAYEVIDEEMNPEYWCNPNHFR